MRISDWSSDVCSSDLGHRSGRRARPAHGVDFDAVEAGARQPCPPDLAAIPHPRIGYTGRVNLKLDFRLIAAAAARRPALQWVFIGATGIGTTYSFDARPDVNAEWEQLNSLGNVPFLGLKDRRDIHVYLNGCDILSLPLSRSEEHTSELQSLMRTTY